MEVLYTRFGLVIGFIGLLVVTRDYTLHFLSLSLTHTHTHIIVHSQGFASRWWVVVLEQGQPSLVSTIEELTEWRVAEKQCDSSEIRIEFLNII
jgi:hypothetical protein